MLVLEFVTDMVVRDENISSAIDDKLNSHSTIGESPKLFGTFTRIRMGTHLRKTRQIYARNKEQGFTLVELLVVVAILGLLIGLVAPAMMRQLGSAKHRIAEQSVARLAGILDIYRLDIGSYPSTDQGLGALNASPAGAAGWSGPYLNDETGIVDPWGRPFEYRSPSQRAGRAFDIASLGADGKPGGSGEDADIFNR